MSEALAGVGPAAATVTASLSALSRPGEPRRHLRFDLADRVAPRVSALLADAPVDGDDAAIRRWLAEVAEVRSVATDQDLARLLELSAIVRANLTCGHELTARDIFRDATQAAELYEALGQTLPAATNYAAAAIAAVQSTQVSEALEIAVRALVAFESLPDAEHEPIGEARMANMLGVLCYQFFDYERALQFYEVAVRALASVQAVWRWTAAAHNVAEVALLLAREAEGQDGALRAARLDRAEELARQIMAIGEPRPFRDVDGRRLLACVLCERGRPDEAWSLLRAARSAAGDPPSVGQVGGLHLISGRCLHGLGRREDALVELDAALDLLDPDWDLAEYMFALQLRSTVREEAGDTAGALADVRRLSEQIWGRHQRQVGGFMDQVWGRAGTEGERRSLEARAQDLIRTAEQDPLTGLANRRALERFCAQLPPQEPVCVVLVDVDHFKQVNDRYGHAAGDAVLKQVADILVRSVRGVDRVARWGGEEFLIALPGAGRDLGAEAAARVRRRVEAHRWDAVAPGLRLTLSAGVAGGSARELGTLLARADSAMYTAKRTGRNRIVGA